MSSGPGTAIVCAACGRRFAWKQHLAGRAITCKCGAPITVPGGAAAAATSAKIKTMIALGGGLAVIVVGLLLLSKYGSRLTSTPPAATIDPNLPGQDGRVVAMINDGKAHEARQWISGGEDRAVTGLRWTHEQTQKYIDLWYNRGAKTVLAFGESFWTSSLAIELPDDKDKRQFFFDFIDSFQGRDPRSGIPIQTDVNQKYLVVFFTNPNPGPVDLSGLNQPRQ